MIPCHILIGPCVYNTMVDKGIRCKVPGDRKEGQHDLWVTTFVQPWMKDCLFLHIYTMGKRKQEAQRECTNRRECVVHKNGLVHQIDASLDDMVRVVTYLNSVAWSGGRAIVRYDDQSL